MKILLILRFFFHTIRQNPTFFEQTFLKSISESTNSVRPVTYPLPTLFHDSYLRSLRLLYSYRVTNSQTHAVALICLPTQTLLCSRLKRVHRIQISLIIGIEIERSAKPHNLRHNVTQFRNLAVEIIIPPENHINVPDMEGSASIR